MNFFLKEFEEHLPFAIFVSFIAILLVLIGQLFDFHLGRGVFEWTHFIHLFFSAAATSAVYARYRKNLLIGVLIGIVGAILIGSLSDVLLPFAGASIFQIPVLFHLPILEEPFLVIGVSLMGAILGYLIKRSLFSHSIHVFLSVFASLFYLINYAVIGDNLLLWLLGFLIVIITVWLPCCFSDIGFPMLFVGKRDSCNSDCCHSHKHS
jgi:hypothetical protein